MEAPGPSPGRDLHGTASAEGLASARAVPWPSERAIPLVLRRAHLVDQDAVGSVIHGGGEVERLGVEDALVALNVARGADVPSRAAVGRTDLWLHCDGLTRTLAERDPVVWRRPGVHPEQGRSS